MFFICLNIWCLGLKALEHLLTTVYDNFINCFYSFFLAVDSCIIILKDVILRNLLHDLVLIITNMKVWWDLYRTRPAAHHVWWITILTRWQDKVSCPPLPPTSVLMFSRRPVIQSLSLTHLHTHALTLFSRQCNSNYGSGGNKQQQQWCWS